MCSLSGVDQFLTDMAVGDLYIPHRVLVYIERSDEASGCNHFCSFYFADIVDVFMSGERENQIFISKQTLLYLFGVVEDIFV